VAEEVQLQEKGSLLQEEGSGGFRSGGSAQREGGFGVKRSLLREREGGFHQTDQELKVHLIEHQDVQKALVMHQDQEDQEETNV
jgi:hypothetical protein